MDKQIKAKIQEKLSSVFKELTGLDVKAIVLPSKDSRLCDLFSPSAMQIAKQAHMRADELAQLVADKMQEAEELAGSIDRVEAKSGFINFFLSSDAESSFLRGILEGGDSFFSGFIPEQKRKNILLEFVSANPTGPLSIAHARQAAIGDALVKILRYGGAMVSSEYYLNDVGFQIQLLGESLKARCLQVKGIESELPENGYQGAYLKDIAEQLLKERPDCLETFSIQDFSEYAVEKILSIIKKQLLDFGVEFDNWYSQKVMEEEGKVDAVLEFLKEKGLLYEKDGALWFSSSNYGDDKDRVLIKSDGAKTYFTADIAYHKDKFNRGYEFLINIWGPDHHGYIPRLEAVIEAMGFDRKAMRVIIAQLVTLYKDGQPLKMSTRAGQYITIDELIEQVGRDAARFFLIMRRTNSHLDFDMDLAIKQAPENPVYYVQYAHARACRILEMARERDLSIENISDFDISLAQTEAEKGVLHSLRGFENALKSSAEDLDPFPVVNYLKDLAGDFHRFYERCRVLGEGIEDDLAKTRLVLVFCIKEVLRIGLSLLGISAPERM